uniref:Phloem protein 2-15 n=1 Tax=Boehmeria nivea TaxID=83906 RepID=A0A2Z3EP10_BOENI|nr:phloem protein 2-15 [Boehmeria nivea]
MGISGSKPKKQIAEAKPPLITPYTKAEAAKRVLESLQNWEGITKEANLNEDGFPQKQLAKLHNGVFLNQKRQKYWVDKMGKNCFMLYAKDFHIVWGDNDNHWHWTQLDTPSSEKGVEVAELFKVSWLEVRGGFDTKKLSDDTSYEVSFVIKMMDESFGWHCYPVNFILNLPDGSRHESKVDFSTLRPREQWVEIPVGKFRTSPTIHGDMVITMCEMCQLWKKGLVFKGVKIQPKI